MAEIDPVKPVDPIGGTYPEKPPLVLNDIGYVIDGQPLVSGIMYKGTLTGLGPGGRAAGQQATQEEE